MNLNFSYETIINIAFDYVFIKQSISLKLG